MRRDIPPVLRTAPFEGGFFFVLRTVFFEGGFFFVLRAVLFYGGFFFGVAYLDYR